MNATVAPVALRAFSMPGAMSAKPEVPASYWNFILYFCLGFRVQGFMAHDVILIRKYTCIHLYTCVYIYITIFIYVFGL